MIMHLHSLVSLSQPSPVVVSSPLPLECRLWRPAINLWEHSATAPCDNYHPGLDLHHTRPHRRQDVITLPFNYLSAADPSKINTFTTTTVTSPATASCVFAPGSAAAGSTLTCTIELGSGNLAACVQLMTLIQGAVTASSVAVWAQELSAL